MIAMHDSEKGQNINAAMRAMPSMEELLGAPWAAEFCRALGREQVKSIISQVCGQIRQELRAGKPLQEPPAELAQSRAAARLRARAQSSLKPVVNATGVIIHTNLGRAPLPAQAVQAVAAIAGTYSTLEYSPEKGGREGRGRHIEWLICQITGAAAALVVNNNAAAVLLALSATAKGRGVVVSAGELVEIGDSFRIPDILSFSGAEMAIVGCTNSTRPSDYERAITENTAVLLKVHPSNYRIEGFTAAVERRQLAELAAARGLVFIEDLGSGLLCDIERPLASNEHKVKECIEAGVDIVTFSGDKLLGGPQIGVIAGTKQLVEKMRSHQLYRALRVDKMSLAAFEATLRLYAAGKQQEIPVIKMIETDEAALLPKAVGLCRLLKKTAASVSANALSVELAPAESVIGGGAYPTERLAGYGAALRLAGKSADDLAAAFRAAQTPVIANVKDDTVILHARTLLEGDEEKIAHALAEILNGGKNE
ncbi:MAG: L-seryl-tRNA(Sec) selenium transferase [Spirochaetes bacterium]|nr:L-seryl-tRNA(Sec) selenium transferase [Spirochaetota bacterium]